MRKITSHTFVKIIDIYDFVLGLYFQHCKER